MIFKIQTFSIKKTSKNLFFYFLRSSGKLYRKMLYLMLTQTVFRKKVNQIWRPLATKRGSLTVRAQRHVIAPVISYLRSYDMFTECFK